MTEFYPYSSDSRDTACMSESLFVLLSVEKKVEQETEERT